MSGPCSRLKHELNVAYQLLLDAKRHKLRIADVVLALQNQASTPPSGTSIPKGMNAASLATSPNTMLRLELGHASGSFVGASSLIRNGSPAMPPTGSGSTPKEIAESREASLRRRRWYLGIQSKKDPAHVMTEVYKAMQILQCKWVKVRYAALLVLLLIDSLID